MGLRAVWSFRASGIRGCLRGWWEPQTLNLKLLEFGGLQTFGICRDLSKAGAGPALDSLLAVFVFRF